MTVPKKVLLAVSSYNGVFYSDGKKTGLFYGEALHPFEVFTKAGFEIDLASETGTYGVDEHSISPDFLSEEDIKNYKDPNFPMNRQLQNLKKASDLDPKQYGLFFASAGHASVFDYPTATGLQNIASDIYRRGGIVSAVCHGPAILPGVTGNDGKSIINGKKVTGFTTQGEQQMGLLSIMDQAKVKTIETLAAVAGATYQAPNQPFDDFSLTEGRLVTGANPASARSTAEKAVAAFNALKE